MKTITLDEAAYDRLKAFKRGKGDSFSAVVKRVVPVSGTLGALLRFVEVVGPTDPVRDEILEESISERSLIDPRDGIRMKPNPIDKDTQRCGIPYCPIV